MFRIKIRFKTSTQSVFNVQVCFLNKKNDKSTSIKRNILMRNICTGLPPCLYYYIHVYNVLIELALIESFQKGIWACSPLYSYYSYLVHRHHRLYNLCKLERRSGVPFPDHESAYCQQRTKIKQL